jgi:hypothetical protein
LAIVAVAGAVTVLALVGHPERVFGPSVATMAGIYLMTYALGRPWAAWPAFVALSAAVAVLQVLWLQQVWAVHPAVGMTALLVPLWSWAVARGRIRDGRLFASQTAAMVGFAPRVGVLLAGVGFLAHGGWDAHHFRVNRVVHRSWSEFCGVVDVAVGTALVAVAVAVA